MKKVAVIIFVLLVTLALSSCGTAQNENESVTTTEAQSSSLQKTENTVYDKSEDTDTTDNMEKITMKISVKSSEYEIIYELNGSRAANELYAQLPLELNAQPFSNNEITFYPPKELNTEDTPLSGGAAGSLSYYVPWGDVVMFYAPCSPNGSLYELGTVISGKENISKLNGTIIISAYTD